MPKNSEPAVYKKIEKCCVAHIVHSCQQALNNSGESELGVITLNIIVDNCEQYEQHNIVQSCFQQYCKKLTIFRP